MMKIPAAVIQMTSGSERKANLDQAEGLVRQAAGAGARIVVLPETFDLIGPPPGVEAVPWKRDHASTSDPSDSTCQCMSALAAELKLYLYAGSIYFRHDPQAM